MNDNGGRSGTAGEEVNVVECRQGMMMTSPKLRQLQMEGDRWIWAISGDRIGGICQ